MARHPRRGGAGLIRATHTNEPLTDSVHSHLDRTVDAVVTAANRGLKAAGIGARERRRFGPAYRVGTVGHEGGRPARG